MFSSRKTPFMCWCICLFSICFGEVAVLRPKLLLQFPLVWTTSWLSWTYILMLLTNTWNNSCLGIWNCAFPPNPANQKFLSTQIRGILYWVYAFWPLHPNSHINNIRVVGGLCPLCILPEAAVIFSKKEVADGPCMFSFNLIRSVFCHAIGCAGYWPKESFNLLFSMGSGSG